MRYVPEVPPEALATLEAAFGVHDDAVDLAVDPASFGEGRIADARRQVLAEARGTAIWRRAVAKLRRQLAEGGAAPNASPLPDADVALCTRVVGDVACTGIASVSHGRSDAGVVVATRSVCPVCAHGVGAPTLREGLLVLVSLLNEAERTAAGQALRSPLPPSERAAVKAAAQVPGHARGLLAVGDHAGVLALQTCARIVRDGRVTGLVLPARLLEDEAALRRAEAAQWLLLDGLGRTTGDKAAHLAALLEARMRGGRGTIAASDLDAQELRASVGTEVWSRLLAVCGAPVETAARLTEAA